MPLPIGRVAEWPLPVGEWLRVVGLGGHGPKTKDLGREAGSTWFGMGLDVRQRWRCGCRCRCGDGCGCAAAAGAGVRRRVWVCGGGCVCAAAVHTTDYLYTFKRF